MDEIGREQERLDRLLKPARIAAIPPFADSHAGRMERLAKQGVAASLAGGIIAASGKPHTVAEAVKVLHEVLEAMSARKP